jgi:hypothetical protein
MVGAVVRAFLFGTAAASSLALRLLVSVVAVVVVAMVAVASLDLVTSSV